MKKIVEASYLTAENAAEYRTILRYFYLQHERMRDFISPEEVLDYMRSLPHYEQYGEEQLLGQLGQLLKWNNLSARQDMTNARTIEEYKKKRFRYQPTPYTIEIERMISVLEKKSDQNFGGSLEKSQFDRLLERMNMLAKELQDQLPGTTESYMRLWDDLLQYFQSIRTNTADYIAYINSEQTDQRMQSEAFLVYKNQFTTYLRDFIVSLQRTSYQISDQLMELDEKAISPFIVKLVTHRKQIPRLEEISDSTVEGWYREFNDLWRVIRAWFIGADGQPSELERLQMQTNEMIRRITRYVQRLSERNYSYHSRKKDYLHLADMYLQTSTMKDAHKLSAVVFGLMTIRHLKVEEDTTEDIHADIWEEEPIVLPIKPRTRAYREKTKPGAMVSNAEKKAMLMQEHLKNSAEQQELVEAYFKNDQITLSELGVVKPFVRKIFLGWIGKSVTNEQNIVKTDYGFAVKVVFHEGEMTVLHAEDGSLEMPNVTFNLMGGNNHGAGAKR